MRSSTWIAIGLLAAVAAWLASGLFVGGEEAGEGEAASAAPPPPMLVEVRASTAEPVPRYIYAQGVAQPYRTADVISSLGGTLGEVLVQQGDTVAAGDVLARVSLEARESQLSSAEARVETLEADLEAARQLESRGFTTEARVRELESQLEEARAALQGVRAEIKDTTVEAPISGIVSDVYVNSGETVLPGAQIARIVDNAPLRVTLDISQRDVGTVDIGRVAVASFATGDLAKGRVCFVAPAADPETRTFRVEIRVPNEERAIPSVVSTEVRFQTGEAEAHFVSPAILALNEAGALGVKSVGEDRTVRFHPAEIVRTGREGVWIGGPPQEALLIVTGQGFVREGQRVRVEETQETPGGRAAGNARLPTATVEASEFDGAEDIPEPPPAEELCAGTAANPLLTSSVPAAGSGAAMGGGGANAAQPAGGSGATGADAQAGSGPTGEAGEAQDQAVPTVPSIAPTSPNVPSPPVGSTGQGGASGSSTGSTSGADPSPAGSATGGAP